MLSPLQSQPPRSQSVATVVANVPVCREHYRIIVRVDSFPETSPGQFMQLQCRDGDRDYEPRREWDADLRSTSDVERDEFAAPMAMLRRPFSLAGRRDTDRGVELEIIHR